MNYPHLLRNALALAFALVLPAAAWSADPIAGQAKFTQICSTCHTVASTAVDDRGRNSPAKIRNAMATIPEMSALSGLSAADLENIAAFLGDSPGSLAFGSTTVGASSASAVVTVRASTFAALTSLSSSVTGDFSLQGGTCGASLASDASCTIGVVFSPTASGTRTGTLSIVNSGLTTPVAIALTGAAAAAPQATVSLDSSNLAFGNQVVGSAGASRTVTVSNTGAASLTFSGITVTGTAASDFTSAGTCAVAAVVAAGGHCSVVVTFAPTATGARSAVLTLASNASNSNVAVALGGTGQAMGVPAVTLAPATLSFGAATVGAGTAARTVTLLNSGTASLAIQGIQATGPFSVSQNCGASLAPSGTCSISVVFTPAAAGASTGAVTVSTNAAGSPQSVPLSGTGLLSTAGNLQWSTTDSLDFGTVAVGADASTRTLTLSNSGADAADLVSLGIAGTDAADFRIDTASTCASGATLAAGASCEVVVGFAPGAIGSRSASLNVASDNALTPEALALTGTASAPPTPALTLSATSLAFVAPAGASAAAQTLTLTNSGAGDLHVSAITLADPRFTATSTGTDACGVAPFTLPAGASCSLQVAWAGTGSDATEASTLTVTGDMQPATASVSLQGQGTVEHPVNAGGGGCTLGGNTDAVDPLLIGMATLAAFLAWRRRRAQ